MAQPFNTYIVLLRGVMPTGKNKVPMARLRGILVEAGYMNVRTYIQSGNALVDTQLSAQQVEEHVHRLIKEQIGADLTVIVRTREQLQKVLDENPFTNGYDLSRVFFVQFAKLPPQIKAEELMAQDFGEEKLVVTETAGYMYIPGNAARSKLSNAMLEKKLGVSATTRNFNTLKKVVELGRIEL